MDIIKKLKRFLTSYSSDLRIICNNNQVIQSHKILFVLLHSSLEEIFIQDEFTDQTVTVFVPIDSEDLKAALDFNSLDNKIIFDSLFKSNSAPEHVTIKPEIDDKEGIKNISTDETELDNVEDPLHSKNAEKENEDNDNEEDDHENDLHIKEIDKHKKEAVNKHVKKEPKLATLKLADLLKNFEPEPETNTAECETCGKLDCKTCHLCGKQFSRSPNMRKHVKFIHNPENIFLQCEKCEYKTPIRDSMMKHVMNVHSIAKLVPCHICGKKVKQSTLRDHVKRKHEEQKKVRCEVCGSEVLNSQALWQHMRKVHQERQHLCEQCSYTAASDYNLRLHVNKMHLGIKELPKSQCEFCDVTTTNLPRHVKIYHAEKIKNNLCNPTVLPDKYRNMILE